MKNRISIVLLLLFFAGLLAVWWAERAGVPTARERRESTNRVLPGLRDHTLAEVKLIEISGGARPIVLERRDGDSWQLTSPVNALAAQSKVESLLSNLFGLAPLPDSGTIEGDGSKYGLKPPERTVRLTGANPKQILAVLDVGSTIGDGRYVRSGDQKGIEVVDPHLLAALDGTPNDWRETALFTLPTLEVQALEIQSPERDIKAEREGPTWRLLQPIQAPGDDARIDGLLANLTSLHVAGGAEGFVADDVKDLKPYGLSNPRLTLRLTSQPAPDRPQTILIGSEDPDEPGTVYAMRGDQDDVLRIDARVLDQLKVDPLSLRSRKVLAFDPARVEFLEIVAGGMNYQLARTEDDWHVLIPEQGKADLRAVLELITELDRLEALDVMDPSQIANPGFDEKSPVFRLWLAKAPPRGEEKAKPTPVHSRPERAPEVTLTLGNFDRRRNLLLARAGGDSAILGLPASAASLVPRGSLAFHNRSLMGLGPDQIATVSVTKEGETVKVTASPKSRDYAHWRLVEPVDAPADARAVASLEVLIARMRADSIVAEQMDNPGTLGLDEPAIRVSWTLRDDSPSGTLLIGDEVPDTPGTRYAKLADRPLIFTLSPEAIRILTAELHDRVVLPFQAPQVHRLVITRDGRSQAFFREASPFGQPSWRPDSSEGTIEERPNSGQLDVLASALAGLSTPEFVQYQGAFPADSGLLEPALRIEVELTGDQGRRELRFGNRRPEDGMFFATTAASSEGAVFLLPPGAWDEWMGRGDETAEPGKAMPEMPADVFAP